ncbi:helix-turn-helix domain-containing protein [Lactobacillus delbrueckii]|uniref:helix-turn-helix domain-containing protein n=1 Tax=Lactobacillus delbrueckii TaxID=1584 RepID=UPI003991EAF1
MATTALGKFLRKIRIDRDERLYDMAKHLGVSSAFLSSVENGHKKASTTLINNIIDAYNLDMEQQEQLKDAVSLSEHKIDISQFSPQKQEATLMFARKFDELTDEQIDQIRNILEGDGDNH